MDIARRNGLAAWHRVVEARDPGLLAELLADDVVFHSPIVFKPQAGKPVTTLYLAAALNVLGNQTFRYVREVAEGDSAVLEFVVTLEGGDGTEVEVNGIDMIRFNDEGQIEEFKVMLRPMKAIQLVAARMAGMLATFTQSS